MSVENIVNKIIDDAKKLEAEILEEANREAKSLKESKESEIKNIIENNKIKAENEGISKRDRLIQNAKLQVRNNKLKAKQDIIFKVFEETLNRLNTLSDEEFIGFVKNTLTLLDVKDEGILLLNSNKHKLITEEMVTNCNSKIKLSEADDSIEDGFVLKVNNVHYNYTFKALVEALRVESASEVSRELF